MKSQNKIENILKEIWQDSIREKAKNKKRWYKIESIFFKETSWPCTMKVKLQSRGLINFTWSSRKIRKNHHYESF